MTKRSHSNFEAESHSSQVDSSDVSVSVRIVDLPSKFQQTDEISLSGETAIPQSNADMKCSLPPHKQTLSFRTFEEYEIHYAKEHTHRCLECRKNFPTGHFLELHIEENHDSLVAVRRERGEKTVSNTASFLISFCPAINS